MMQRAILFAAIGFLLTACQTTVGEGPITFSEGVAARYQYYMNSEYPEKFAVSEDGNAAQFYYCPWNYAGSCTFLSDTKVVEECEAQSKGVPCKMFAKQRQVVWQNPGDFLKNHVQGDVKLDGTEPVLYGRAIRDFKIYKEAGAPGKFRAFAVNYRLSTKKLIGYGYSVGRATTQLATSKALAECKRDSDGREPQNCKLYMVDDEKVWFTQN